MFGYVAKIAFLPRTNSKTYTYYLTQDIWRKLADNGFIGFPFTIVNNQGFNYRNNPVTLIGIEKTPQEELGNFMIISESHILDDSLYNKSMYVDHIQGHNRTYWLSAYHNLTHAGLDAGTSISKILEQIVSDSDNSKPDIFNPKSSDNWTIKLTGNTMIPITPDASRNTLPSVEPKNTPNKIVKEKKSMFGNMFKNLKFGKYTDPNVRVSIYGLAVSNGNGSFVSYKGDEITDVSDFLIDMEGMLYAMPVAINAVKQGDVIIHKGTPVVVIEVPDSEDTHDYYVMDVAAMEKKIILPSKNAFGFNYVTKIVNFAEDMFGGFSTPNSDNPFGNMLPLMMMSQSDSGNDNDVFKMMMLSQMMSASNSETKMDMSNPLMLMALMGK